MRLLLGKHAATVLVVAITAAVTAGGPVIARTVVDFARNADKVDGRHAVGPKASLQKRAGKLVATNRAGRLPNNIIRKAPDAKALGGTRAARYATECDPGTLGGAMTVPAAADFPAEWSPINGHVFVHLIGGPPPGIDRCDREGVSARRVATGVYEIDVSGSLRICFIDHLPAVITPHTGSPAFATHETVCEEDGILLIRASLWDQEGQPIDVPFDVALLHPKTVGVP